LAISRICRHARSHGLDRTCYAGENCAIICKASSIYEHTRGSRIPNLARPVALNWVRCADGQYLDGLSMTSSDHCCLSVPNSPPNSPLPPPSPPAPPLLASFSIHILKNSLSFISSKLVITVFNCASCLLKLSSVGNELICRLALAPYPIDS